MKKRGIIIAILLVLGLIGMVSTEFYIKPFLKGKEEQYALENKKPESHHIEIVEKYKNKYMGNGGNISNLNYNLPLSEIKRTNEINGEDLEFIIHYEASTDEIETRYLKSSLIYNATANFALIENLQLITFNFQDLSYTFSRANLEKWYGTSASSLLENNLWKEKVQKELKMDSYIEEAFTEILEEKE